VQVCAALKSDAASTAAAVSDGMTHWTDSAVFDYNFARIIQHTLVQTDARAFDTAERSRAIPACQLALLHQ